MSWEVKRDGVVICWGESDKGKPGVEECKKFRSDGYRVYVDGKEVKSGKAG